ncbi:hypothetical protein MA16_Dca007025 [Dendrobium catenatum]|uniref:Uncharacterized protein n=1 Tax=Dendrobium catenatum TaxID=906689 RepID=A0A2I0VX50_9ASPA|nr:hypothetical protein MA16_Dca007025 [Dendrobium catenatum]
MKVTIANSSHGSNRPVNSRYVENPQACLSEIWYSCTHPCFSFMWISVCQQVVETSCTVH